MVGMARKQTIDISDDFSDWDTDADVIAPPKPKKKKAGRPKKVTQEAAPAEAPVKKKRGRPKKAPAPAQPVTENRNYLKGNRTFTEPAVLKIRQLYAGGEGKTISEIHRIVVKKGFAVTYASVRNICQGTTWKYLLDS